MERVEPKICRRLHSGIVDSLAMKQKAGRGVGFEVGAGGVVPDPTSSPPSSSVKSPKLYSPSPPVLVSSPSPSLAFPPSSSPGFSGVGDWKRTFWVEGEVVDTSLEAEVVVK